MILTLHEIARALGVAAPSSPDAPVTGYSIDSRTLQRGDLFFAIRGDRLDGHEFVARALDSGAVAAVVDAARAAKYSESVQQKLFAVPNVVAALQELGAYVRRRWGGPVVAITGSAGKTTTKQAIAALLSTRFRVLQSEGNLNNHLGLPLSLLRLSPESEAGVFELGMSAPGEIRLLANLARPDIGVVTNVSAVHLEFFPDRDAIARAKHELIETLDSGAWAVLNADDPRVWKFGEHLPDRTLYFGTSERSHIRALQLQPLPTGGFSFTVPAKAFAQVPPGALRAGRFRVKRAEPERPSDVRFELPLLGRHNVLNVLAALGVCYTFGILPQVLREAVASLRPGTMRGEMVRLANGALAINDCYNSNPEALETMLAAVTSLPARRHIAVLGGMMELGGASEELHHGCGRRVAELRFDVLLTVGDHAKAFAEGARSAGMAPASLHHFDSPEEAGSYLRELLDDGDVVLLKASRSVHLEKIWPELEPLKAAAARQRR
ncbi:MAG: UDP-N-acetylmuramoyl-tripeptide--D-alanyl-D-alanine ligase [Acidobacteria bacterium]|nr:UDP-N-acetylmuramoyl-tripeptide--D-alanyl-D-alanine ligase [Acidobacteriota bacterium]